MEPGGQEVRKPPSELISKHKKQQTTSGWGSVLEGLAELSKPKCAAATGANVVLCSGKQQVHLHQSLVTRFTRISDWLPNMSECARLHKSKHRKTEPVTIPDNENQKENVMEIDPLFPSPPYNSDPVNIEIKQEEILAHSDAFENHSLFVEPLDVNYEVKCEKKDVAVDERALEMIGRPLTKQEENIHFAKIDKYYVCLICAKTATHKGNMWCHVKRHTGEKSYQCQFCPKVFAEARSLKIHSAICKGKSEPISTEAIKENTAFKTLHSKEVKEDEMKAQVETPLDVNYDKTCNERIDIDFDERALEMIGRPLTEQEETKHFAMIDKNYYVCLICAKTANHLGNTRNHVKRHKLYQCQVCPKVFAEARNLKSHLKNIHSREVDEDEIKAQAEAPRQVLTEEAIKLYQEQFKTKTGYDLDKNILEALGRSITEKEENQLFIKTNVKSNGRRHLMCLVCSKVFNNSGNMVGHVRSHTGIKPFQCEHCQKTFTAASHLRLHIKIHTGDKPFKCQFCPKSFYTKAKLELHERIHTGEKPFQCQYCPMAFARKDQVDKHVLTHTGEHRYQCKYCPKRLSTKAILEDHERIHTGEKPFECPLCSKAFNKKCNMDAHVRTHTGEKQYKCDKCPKQFERKGKFLEHLKTHTEDEPLGT